MDDYRFCVKASLDILKTLREEMTNDCINLQPDIKTGLHKSGENEKTVRSLYFQKYIVIWLDSHWKTIREKLINDTDHSIDERRRMIVLFAEHFKEMLTKCMHTEVFSKELIPDLLKIHLVAINEILKSNDKVEEQLESLSAETVKHKEQFDRLIKELK